MLNPLYHNNNNECAFTTTTTLPIIGSIVIVQGLQQATEYNDRIGLVVGHDDNHDNHQNDSEDSRWHLQLLSSSGDDDNRPAIVQTIDALAVAAAAAATSAAATATATDASTGATTTTTTASTTTDALIRPNNTAMKTICIKRMNLHRPSLLPFVGSTKSP
jgi:hypothetical protein